MEKMAGGYTSSLLTQSCSYPIELQGYLAQDEDQIYIDCVNISHDFDDFINVTILI